jgi:hypothetical protein
MSRLVMLPMRDKRQSFCWFRPSRPWVCRIAYGASGHRATLRSKALEADFVAVVRGLTQESAWLHRNSAVRAHPEIRTLRRPQSGGAGRQPGSRGEPLEAGGRITGSHSHSASQRRLTA